MIVIDRVAGTVSVNELTRTVDTSDMALVIASVEYDAVKKMGKIFYTEAPGGEQQYKTIGAQAFDNMFAQYLPRWRAAANLKPTLAQAKKNAREQINAKRDSLEQAGFQYLDQTMPSDAAAMARMALFAFVAQQSIAAGQPQNFRLNALDDSQVNVSAEQMVQMPAALVDYIKGLRDTARDKKAAINAAKTVEDVAAVVW